MQPAKFREMLPGLGWSIGHKDTMVKGNLMIRFSNYKFEIWERDPQVWIATISYYDRPKDNVIAILDIFDKGTHKTAYECWTDDDERFITEYAEDVEDAARKYANWLYDVLPEYYSKPDGWRHTTITVQDGGGRIYRFKVDTEYGLRFQVTQLKEGS